MSTAETVFDFSQYAAGFADAATLLAEAAQHLSEAALAMSHGLQPELHVPQKLPLDETTSSECKSIKDHNQSGSEDANTGNNIRRPGSRIGRFDDLDPPTAPLIEKDQLAPGSESSPSPLPSPSHEVSTVSRQDEFRGAILSPGRYYVVLEEEFDILPLIAAYASLCRIKDTVLSTKHTCAIVTSQEYQHSNFRSYLTSLGFIKHPKSSLIKESHGTGFLSTFRTIVQGVLHDQKLHRNICSLYKEFLRFYMSPPSKDVWWSETRAAQLANSFAAKTLLHGRKEDGSSAFQPNGQMVPVDREFIDKTGLKRAAQLGLVQEGTANYLNSVSLARMSGPSQSALPRIFTPAPNPVTGGRWYIIFQEDFDVIPFISYQVEQNPKVVCFTSHGTNAKPYQGILKLTTNQHIVRLPNTKAGADKGITTFNSLRSGLLLLQGAKQPSSLPSNVDVAIYWGVPPEPHFTHYLNNLGATHTYILISSVDGFADKQRGTTRDGIRGYPGLLQVNSTGPTSLLHPYRVRVRQVMQNIPSRIPKKIYNTQVGKWVKKGNRVSMRESIIRVNQFVARVLLHGQSEDGSMMYPPVQPRPSVKLKHVNLHDLQPFVNEGLMWVEYN
ncbi:unnamed protein product [Rhizoctonia solani]|uniref:Uncharacterized protein n=1 Tax=Rhizoctonia solani TaxID=456999 RepID=A0A8H3DIF9_9AGAM|nr:unnamed protein product [Rhizoctonia solani]